MNTSAENRMTVGDVESEIVPVYCIHRASISKSRRRFVYRLRSTRKLFPVRKMNKIDFTTTTTMTRRDETRRTTEASGRHAGRRSCRYVLNGRRKGQVRLSEIRPGERTRNSLLTATGRTSHGQSADFTDAARRSYRFPASAAVEVAA